MIHEVSVVPRLAVDVQLCPSKPVGPWTDVRSGSRGEPGTHVLSITYAENDSMPVRGVVVRIHLGYGQQRYGAQMMNDERQEALAALVALETMRRPYQIADLLSSEVLGQIDMDERDLIVERSAEIIQEAVDVVVGEHFTQEVPDTVFDPLSEREA